MKKIIVFVIIIICNSIFGSRIELFSEDFDSNTMSNWTIVDNNSDGKSWGESYTDAHSGMYSASIAFNGGVNDDWLVSPQIDLGTAENDKILSFWSRNGLNDIKVRFSAMDSNITSFGNNLEVSLEETSGSWKKYQIFLPVQTGEIYLAWYATRINSFYLYIDEISLSCEATEIPSEVDVVAPSDGADNITTNGTLEWEKSLQAEGYKLFIGTNNPPSSIVNGDDLGDITTYNYQDLSANSTYYWQIVPYNAIGNALSSPIWEFTTSNNQWLGATVSPLVIDAELAPDQIVNKSIIINNSGADASSINYRAEISYLYDDKKESSTILGGSKAFAYISNVLFSFNTDNPEAVFHEADLNGNFFAADFSNSNEFMMYGLNGDDNKLYSINTHSGKQTLLGNSPIPFESYYTLWTDMACDKTSGIMYACASDLTSSKLCTIDLSNGAVTEIAVIEDVEIAIGMAIDGEQNGYLYDSKSDLAYRLDLSTGETTELGPIGFNSEHAQSMAWDPKTDNIYLTACTDTNAELRLFNRENGATTSLCELQGQAYGLGFPYTPQSWLALENGTGVVEINTNKSINLTLDPSQINLQGENEVIKTAKITLYDESNNQYISDITVNMTITQNSIEDDNSVNKVYLSQNYPNPFNPVTKIDYELSNTNFKTAKIVVYNSAGQIAWQKSLVESSFSRSGSVQFNGTKFNSGIYYYSLVLDGRKMSTKKMILVK